MPSSERKVSRMKWLLLLIYIDQTDVRTNLRSGGVFLVFCFSPPPPAAKKKECLAAGLRQDSTVYHPQNPDWSIQISDVPAVCKLNSEFFFI